MTRRLPKRGFDLMGPVTDPRTCYALAILLGVPDAFNFDWPAWLTYGEPDDMAMGAGVCIIPSGLFSIDYGTPGSLPVLPLPTVENIPLLFGSGSVQRSGEQLIAHADILASAYFLVTRYEAWVRKEVRDEHGRFLGRDSLPWRAGFIDRPIVEEYARLLRKWASEVGIILPEPKRRFRVLLTHDVDWVGLKLSPIQPLRSFCSALLGRQSWKQAARTSAISLRIAEDPVANLGNVICMDKVLSDRYDSDRCKCVYFFMAGGRSEFDRNYDIRSPKAREAVACVLASGAEVGLHASYEAGRTPELLASERATLEEVARVPITKNRYHFLGWHDPRDGGALAAAGISWDSTLGYPDVAGFRLGVCHPIPLFDPVLCCPLGIEEHPLIAMDGTLSSREYMGLSEEAALSYVCRLADTTARYQGEFVALWHNHLISMNEMSYHRHLYGRVIDHLGELLDAH